MPMCNWKYLSILKDDFLLNRRGIKKPRNAASYGKPRNRIGVGRLKLDIEDANISEKLAKFVATPFILMEL